MSAGRPQDALRPLALGEVLDRAVNLCVRYFVPLSLIFVVYAVPLAVVQYFANQDFTRILQIFTQSVAAGGGRAPDPGALARSLGAVRTNGWYALLMALTFFIAPLPTAALIFATAQAYFGRATSLARAYRTALGRWLPLVGVNALYALALVTLYIVLTIVLVLGVTGIAFVTVAFRGTGIALALLFGLAAFVPMAAFFVVAALAFQVSYFTCVVEGANARRSFVLGVGRVFGGVGLRRSLLVGLVYVIVGVGIFAVEGVGEVLVGGLLHNAVAGSAYSTLVRIATAAFTTAFIAIFYFDLRVREEGLDLQLAAQSTQPAAPPSA